MPMLDNYEVDEFGVIHQIDFTPIKYDKQYISYYEDLSDRPSSSDISDLAGCWESPAKFLGQCWRLDTARAHSSKPRK